jgi:hypothetical protein
MRDLDVGGTLSRIFGIYGDQAGVLLPVAAAVFLIEAVATGVLIEINGALVIVAVLIQVIVATLYAGMVVELVHDVQDGRRDHSIGGLFRAVRGVVVPLILAGVLVGLAVVVGLAFFIIPGLIFLTIFAVVAPAIVVEHQGVGGALTRSRNLVSGNGWQVFAVVIVVFLLSFIVGSIAGAIGSSAGTAGRIVAELVASTLTAPLAGLAAGVLYFELRRIKGDDAAPAAPAAPAA